MANPRNRHLSLHLILLIYHLIVTANEVGIPPVTIFLIGGQILLFLRFIQMPFDDVSQICVSYDGVCKHKEYYRLFLSSFEHADDIHLYYNMISFVMKGKTLEEKFGSIYYIFLIIVFTLLTNLIYIFLNYTLATLFLNTSLLYNCAVGFSGVIFALKVLTTFYWTNRTNSNISIFKFGVWFELIYISILSPNASFLGHLSGIIVGFLYTHGFLGPLMESIRDEITKIFAASQTNQRQNRNRQNDEQQYFQRFGNPDDENYFRYNYGNYNNYARYR